jgi:hypothetical protein
MTKEIVNGIMQFSSNILREETQNLDNETLKQIKLRTIARNLIFFF